ncbi:hypothetical protein GLOIN_2v620650 [Rhizophagus clarus]|uniref:MIR domain-containing protein n=1 Tax=Rhizophagus clarus TaxID=94130 RepID=A0A8H3M177_9GLOM|nr:hypothetical protein GLOIN_2v620650 [Rhizophagus clarus]
MDIPKYDATVHPKEWMDRVHAICLVNNNNIKDKDVLKLCKLHIVPWITIPIESINSLNELIKALMLHSSFKLYKDSIKDELNRMKFEEGGNIIQFLGTFRLHCNNAEITDPQEIKNLLLKTYSSNEFFKNEFLKRVSPVTSIDEIFKIYNNIVSDWSKIIKYSPDCLIAIKHVQTGRYLSSCETKYERGSQRQVVYAGEQMQHENSWWYPTCIRHTHKEPYQNNKVMSPVTFYTEVHCFPYIYANLSFVKTDQTKEDNETPYVKDQDKVYLKTDADYILRSQDVTFKIKRKQNKTMPDSTFEVREVVGHKEKAGGDDEWIIEKK